MIESLVIIKDTLLLIDQVNCLICWIVFELVSLTIQVSLNRLSGRMIHVACIYCLLLYLLNDSNVCCANSFKRSITHVEFNKSIVILTNDVQLSKSTSDLLKTTGTF